MPSLVHWIYDDAGEMQLRLRPLREHWEARGPGMIRQLQTLLPWLDVSDRIDVRLVEPNSGGGGRVADDAIEFEAVLANRIPQLPEVTRLAWLICCQATKANDLLSLSLIPPTLLAAEYVELARYDEATLDLAIDAWLSTSTPITGAKLSAWWETASDSGDVATWNAHVATLNETSR